MDSKTLRTAGLAAIFCLTALAPGASAGTCPPTRTFTGILLPGETDIIYVPLFVQGNTTFHFVPTWPAWYPVGQTVTMRVGGYSMTGEAGLAIGIDHATPGIYPVQLRGQYLWIDGMAAVHYKLLVYQDDC